MKTKTLIVIPGIGSIKKETLAKNLKKILSSHDVDVQLHLINFRLSIEEDERQMSDLLKVIKQVPKPISLFGSSAGGLVGLKFLNEYSEIYRLITFRTPYTISGMSKMYIKIRRQEKLLSYVDAQKKLVKGLTDNRKKDILSLAASGDWLVRPKDAYIEGANNKVFHGIGHLISANTGIYTCKEEITSFL